jgi:hypothetical protein
MGPSTELPFHCPLTFVSPAFQVNTRRLSLTRVGTINGETNQVSLGFQMWTRKSRQEQSSIKVTFVHGAKWQEWCANGCAGDAQKDRLQQNMEQLCYGPWPLPLLTLEVPCCQTPRTTHAPAIDLDFSKPKPNAQRHLCTWMAARFCAEIFQRTNREPTAVQRAYNRRWS